MLLFPQHKHCIMEIFNKNQFCHQITAFLDKNNVFSNNRLCKYLKVDKATHESSSQAISASLRKV